MRRNLILALAKIGIVIAALAGIGYLAVPADAHGTHGHLYPPCVDDQGQPHGNLGDACIWDARHQGNGFGHSFIFTERGRVIHIPHRAVHPLTAPGVW